MLKCLCFKIKILIFSNILFWKTILLIFQVYFLIFYRFVCLDDLESAHKISSLWLWVTVLTARRFTSIIITKHIKQFLCTANTCIKDHASLMNAYRKREIITPLLQCLPTIPAINLKRKQRTVCESLAYL